MNSRCNLNLALKRVQSQESQARNTLYTLINNKTEKEIEGAIEIIRKLPQKRDIVKRLMIKRKEINAQRMLEKMPQVVFVNKDMVETPDVKQIEQSFEEDIKVGNFQLALIKQSRSIDHQESRNISSIRFQGSQLEQSGLSLNYDPKDYPAKLTYCRYPLTRLGQSSRNKTKKDYLGLKDISFQNIIQSMRFPRLHSLSVQKLEDLNSLHQDPYTNSPLQLSFQSLQNPPQIQTSKKQIGKITFGSKSPGANESNPYKNLKSQNTNKQKCIQKSLLNINNIEFKINYESLNSFDHLLNFPKINTTSPQEEVSANNSEGGNTPVNLVSLYKKCFVKSKLKCKEKQVKEQNQSRESIDSQSSLLQQYDGSSSQPQRIMILSKKGKQIMSKRTQNSEESADDRQISFNSHSTDQYQKVDWKPANQSEIKLDLQPKIKRLQQLFQNEEIKKKQLQKVHIKLHKNVKLTKFTQNTYMSKMVQADQERKIKRNDLIL